MRISKVRTTMKKSFIKHGLLYTFAIKLLAFSFGFMHRWHVSTLFENERHFSHLSDTEREMSFRTEMGMYYSYFKTIAEANSFQEGMERVRNDNLSQYPSVINAEATYNLMPEIAAGFLYHMSKSLGIIPKPVCWQIERGDGLSLITSCEGVGVPIYFYLEIIWGSTFGTGFILFTYAASLSRSIDGGLIAVASFFFNHTECTRVQWTPPLRESFAYPAILYQMFMVTRLLKNMKKLDYSSAFGDIVFGTCYALFCWQFSQFVFITQIIAMLILKWFKIIDNKIYMFFCIAHCFSAVTLQSGNDFLYKSMYMCLLLASTFSSFTCNRLSRVFDSKMVTLLEIIMTVVGTKFMKNMFANTGDDEHIFNILRSKLSNYKDFHTMLYTCSVEFDFLQYETYEAIFKTLLLQTDILVGILVMYYWYRNLKSQGFPGCIEPEVAYNFLQTGAFVIMAVFVMRLKLFMTPHLCIIAGLVCSKRYLEKVRIKKKFTRSALIALLLAMMSYNGLQRIMKEREFVGEYSNVDQEELFEWINAKTPKTAVFAGKMSLMANLMLSTGRPIVNNPYYENKDMRERTMKVYEIFSRKDVATVYNTLKEMKVDYIVLEEGLCYALGSWKPGCKMVELWDLMDGDAAKNAGKPPLCPTLFRGNAHPFQKVFANRSYVVLQLNYLKYVELQPKTMLYQSY